MKKVGILIKKHTKSSKSSSSFSRKTAAFEKRIPFSYGEVLIKAIERHRSDAPPIIFGHILLSVTPDDSEFYRFFESFFRRIKPKLRIETHQYVDWLKKYFRLPREGRKNRFATTYTESFYPGGADHEYRLYVDYVNINNLSLGEVKDFVIDVMDEVEADNVPDQYVEQCVSILYKIIKEYVSEYNSFLEVAEEVIEEYIGQLLEKTPDKDRRLKNGYPENGYPESEDGYTSK